MKFLVQRKCPAQLFFPVFMFFKTEEQKDGRMEGQKEGRTHAHAQTDQAPCVTSSPFAGSKNTVI